MNRIRRPLSAPSPILGKQPVLSKQPTSSRPRRKLQKGGSRQGSGLTKQAGPDTQRATPTPDLGPQPASSFSLPAAPDLSDAKWSDYLGPGAYPRGLHSISARPGQPPTSPVGADTVRAPEVTARHSSSELRVGTQLRSLTPGPVSAPTASDDGTLVAFDEEAVYFRPVSLCPSLPSPTRTAGEPLMGPASRPLDGTPAASGMRICVHLLARELTSAITDQPPSPVSELSALQVWLMIGAYERLRSLVLHPSLNLDETGNLGPMFDMWLQALHAVHESLAGGAQTGGGQA